MNCSRCGEEMYQASNGFHECRNFDCPPGTQANYQKSWALVKMYKTHLRARSASDFTVEELSLLLQRNNSGIRDGFEMEKIAKRLGVAAAPPREEG